MEFPRNICVLLQTYTMKLFYYNLCHLRLQKGGAIPPRQPQADGENGSRWRLRGTDHQAIIGKDLLFSWP